MLFNSLHFLIFFPIVCILYYVLPSVKTRNTFLLIASYYFYMNWEPIYALLLLSSTVITYLAALGIASQHDKKRKQLFLTISLILNLGILFLFKYYNFAADNITTLMTKAGLELAMPHFTLLLPVGISFYIIPGFGIFNRRVSRQYPCGTQFLYLRIIRFILSPACGRAY